MGKSKVTQGPLGMHSKTVPSAGIKSVRYVGAAYRGSMNALPGESTNGRAFDRDGNLIDSPILHHGEQPDRRGESKADEVEREDPTRGLGVYPTGTLNR